jgi:hypothetical protein
MEISSTDIQLVTLTERDQIIFKHSVRTSQGTHHGSATTNTKRSKLFMETLIAYCENHTKHIRTPCGQNTEF